MTGLMPSPSRRKPNGVRNHMVDVLSPAERSARMRRVTPHGNRTTELAICRVLREARISGWRRHVAVYLGNAASLAGGVRRYSRPDFVFRRSRVVVFVDGCFWHSCPRHRTMPVGNHKYWAAKLEGNRRRDRRVTRALAKQGWKVVRIWEHDVRERPRHCMQRVRKALAKQRW